MRASISVLGLTALLCACETAQQIANSSADNASPDMVPVLSELSPLSSTFKTWGQVSILFA